MNKNNVNTIENPAQNVVQDALSEFLRESAEKMLKVAIEEEVQNFITSHAEKKNNNWPKTKLYAMAICQNGLYRLGLEK